MLNQADPGNFTGCSFSLCSTGSISSACSECTALQKMVNICSTFNHHDTLTKLQSEAIGNLRSNHAASIMSPAQCRCMLEVHCVWPPMHTCQSFSLFLIHPVAIYCTGPDIGGAGQSSFPLRSGLQSQLLLTVCGDDGNAVQGHLWL